MIGRDDDTGIGDAAQDVFACVIAILIVVIISTLLMRSIAADTGRPIVLADSASRGWTLFVDFEDDQHQHTSKPLCDPWSIDASANGRYTEAIEIVVQRDVPAELTCLGTPSSLVGYGPTGVWRYERFPQLAGHDGFVLELRDSTLEVKPEISVGSASDDLPTDDDLVSAFITGEKTLIEKAWQREIEEVLRNNGEMLEINILDELWKTVLRRCVDGDRVSLLMALTEKGFQKFEANHPDIRRLYKPLFLEICNVYETCTPAVELAQENIDEVLLTFFVCG